MQKAGIVNDLQPCGARRSILGGNYSYGGNAVLRETPSVIFLRKMTAPLQGSRMLSSITYIGISRLTSAHSYLSLTRRVPQSKLFREEQSSSAHLTPKQRSCLIGCPNGHPIRLPCWGAVIRRRRMTEGVRLATHFPYVI